MKQSQGIYLPDDDNHFENHLQKGVIYQGKGTYQFKKLQMAVEAVPEDKRVIAVDIGAHVGTWSRVLSYMFDTVIAFEPLSKNYECLIENCRDRTNVIAYRTGLSDKEEQLTFNPVLGNTGNSCVCENDAPGSEVVNVVPLDDLSYGRIDFIKIDVEGYELNVLNGAKDTIKRCKPVIIVEQKPGNAEKYGLTQFAALEFLKSLGMKVKATKSGDYILTF